MQNLTITALIECVWEFLKKHNFWITVFFLGPIFLIYAIDFLSFIASILQIVITAFISICGFLFIAGCFFGLNPNYELAQYRFAQIILPFKFGYEKTRWLMETVEEPETEDLDLG